LTAVVYLCVSSGAFDQRSQGTRQCGGLALQGGGRHVLLTATPQQGRHRRLPGEVQRGMGGGWTSVAGTHTHTHRHSTQVTYMCAIVLTLLGFVQQKI